MRQLTLTRPGLLALLTLSTGVFSACDPNSLSVFSCGVCRKLLKISSGYCAHTNQIAL